MRASLYSLWIAFACLGLMTAGSTAQQIANKNGQALSSNVSVSIFGAVRAPAVFNLRRQVRLAGVIEMAGGPTDKATGTLLVIHSALSPEGGICIDCLQQPPVLSFYKLTTLQSEDEAANPYLRSGDIVLVAEGPPVFVMGCVIIPQGSPLKNHMTLTQAIATAGGEAKHADLKRVQVIRSNTEIWTRKSLLFDVKAIKKHQAEDPLLQPYDIILVPGKCTSFSKGDYF